MKHNVKALIFDFDLTLVDSKLVSKKVADELFANHNISYAGIPESDLWGGTFKKNSHKVKEVNDTHLLAEEIEALSIAYCMKHHDETKLEAQEKLKKWHSDGIKLCIVSGNTKEIIEQVLNNKHNNSVKFCAVFETNSGHSKTERIKECLDQLGIAESEAMYIGDHIKDILSAQKAGVISCAITTGFHTKEEFSPYNPAVTIDKIEELDRYIA